MLKLKKFDDVNELGEAIKTAGVKTCWAIDPARNVTGDVEKWFDIYKPVTLIYRDDVLIAGAHNAKDNYQVFDLQSYNITKNFTEEETEQIKESLK